MEKYELKEGLFNNEDPQDAGSAKEDFVNDTASRGNAAECKSIPRLAQ